ncbi:YdcF family protein [Actinokineospora bangkokensis]|uniref:DUF218 domain-containing protein n=1 Tax=Actinokineospora bangkokensis TaxID=1193682 RepID=A0A1Q9LP74_9PSEU|nr:YdcF family protein [Actinokineospora bangkokensis]OLR93856.1 hypothetical protein BJP25_16675 [Actinokineospora bangkokensis]
MLLGALFLAAAGSLAVTVRRVRREPRRFGNAVWSGVTAVLVVAWLVAVLPGTRWFVAAGLGVVALVLLVLPWALIANGVVMLRRERVSAANALSLLAGVGVLGVVVGAAVVFLSDVPDWLTTAVTSVVLVVGYLAFLFVALLGYCAVYSGLSARTQPAAVIVLGAGLTGGRVPPLLASRLDRAVQWRERTGSDPLIVVSGGRGADEDVSEAEAMSTYLRAEGVPGSRIVLEERATTTEQNLRESMDLLTSDGHTGPVLAVTNDYHVFRTAVLARRLGLRVAVVGARTASYFVPSAFLREFAALLVQYRRANAAAILVLAAVPPVVHLLA